MEIIKKYKALLLIVLVVAGIFLFFYRMYHNDVKALTDFSASYEKFDKAISDFSVSKTDDLENRASDALAELTTKAQFRISSLIKNDPQLMDQALEVADLSGKELETLRAYKRAIQSKSPDVDRLAQEYSDLTSKRKAAYVHFRELAELKD
jgi:tRNA A37 N6-isopentenylltransferase MiaA